VSEEPTKENIENVEKALILFCLDAKKTVEGIRDILEKIGFKHTSVAADSLARHIQTDLDEYKKQKEGKKDG
jgi:hypothetical protein